MTAVSHPFDDGLPLGGPPHAASAWTELEDHAKSEFPHLRDLFTDDPVSYTHLPLPTILLV